MKKGTYTLAEMLELTGKKTKQQVERHLAANEYGFAAEGRGQKTTFTIHSLSLADELGFKPTYPSAMKTYIDYIKNNKEAWEFESDSEVAWKIIGGTAKLESKTRMILVCRTELSKAGLIKDLREQEEVKFFLKNKGMKEEIEKERFYDLCSYKREVADSKIRESCNFDVSKQEVQDAWKDASMEVYAIEGKYAIKIKRRELLNNI